MAALRDSFGQEKKDAIDEERSKAGLREEFLYSSRT
jgi:hypothetical protein